jgi:hypothetical protein
MSDTSQIDKTRLDEEQRPLRRLLSGPQVRARYADISEMGLWRWIKGGVIPPPDQKINGRNYWWDSTLDKADRARMREAMRAPVKRSKTPAKAERATRRTV